MNKNNDISKRLISLRKEKGLSQEKFGRLINLSGTQIGCYEKGLRNITDRAIDDICRVFGVNEEWLRFGTGDLYMEEKEEKEVDTLTDVLAASVKGDNIKLKELILKLNELDDSYLDALEIIIDGLINKHD